MHTPRVPTSMNQEVGQSVIGTYIRVDNSEENSQAQSCLQWSKNRNQSLLS